MMLYFFIIKYNPAAAIAPPIIHGVQSFFSVVAGGVVVGWYTVGWYTVGVYVLPPVYVVAEFGFWLFLALMAVCAICPAVLITGVNACITFAKFSPPAPKPLNELIVSCVI